MSVAPRGTTREKVQPEVPVEKKKPWLRRVLKMLLLTLLPIIAAAVVIGVSLQVIGIPVWQTTLSYIHGQSGQSGPGSVLASQVSQLKTENTSLTQQVASLTAQLNQQKSTNQSLQSQLSNVTTQLQAKQDAINNAKQEAQIVTQMDPSAAAQVVTKLPDAEAGLVIASLTPSAASAVLAAMDPATAAKLLQIAGQSNTNSVSTGNSTG